MDPDAREEAEANVRRLMAERARLADDQARDDYRRLIDEALDEYAGR